MTSVTSTTRDKTENLPDGSQGVELYHSHSMTEPSLRTFRFLFTLRALAAQHVRHDGFHDGTILGVDPLELIDAFADCLFGGPTEGLGRLVRPAFDAGSERHGTATIKSP